MRHRDIQALRWINILDGFRLPPNDRSGSSASIWPNVSDFRYYTDNRRVQREPAVQLRAKR